MTDEYLDEFEHRFAQLKRDLGFSATLEELDEAFFLRDMALGDGYISPRLDRQVCSRISDTLYSWVNYLHRLAMPSPQSMIENQEHQFFSEEQHKRILSLISELMALVSKNSLLGARKDVDGQGAYIDEALVLFERVRPEIADLCEQAHAGWEEFTPSPR